MTPSALITGGAGFVGTNVADRLASAGERVRVLDNFSRTGTQANLDWLLEEHGDQIEVVEGDVCDPAVVRRGLEGVSRVFHFAAQVAVTSSVADPRHDFQVNLVGALNVLEEMRRLDEPPCLLFTSTNKVYGALEDVGVDCVDGRYEPRDELLRRYGVSESRGLSFCSPYGCSKGGADQYVLDYAKSFGLRTAVFRMSCIYGPHQQGNEDQGWVAHFLKQVMAGKPLTLFGDGRQVRDVLCVDDLVNAMLRATDDMADDVSEGRSACTGRAFNIGGGPSNTTSLHEMLALISEVSGREPEVQYCGWRVGDQRWFVSDNRRFEAACSWEPKVTVREGVEQLHEWLVHDGRPVGQEAR